MLRWTWNQGHQRTPLVATALLVFTLLAACSETALAEREVFAGGPIDLPGWPEAAAAIFNNADRVDGWVHGNGGFYGGEYRGGASSLNTALAAYAKVDIKPKRLIVRSGPGHSASYGARIEVGGPDPEGRVLQKAKAKAMAPVDWKFTILTPDGWEKPRHPMHRFFEHEVIEADLSAAQIDIYVGGNIRWSDVVVPEGLTVSDMRLESHCFTLADGIVLEGRAIDLATNQPIAAKAELERFDSIPGGYNFPIVATATTDAEGRWVLKNAPAGWHRVVVEADGYVPRCVGAYYEPAGGPGWYGCRCGLARPTALSGRVVDEACKPVANAEVRLGDVVATGEEHDQALPYPREAVFSDRGFRVTDGDEHYHPLDDYLDDYKVKTDADGRFRFDQVPIGTAKIWAYKRVADDRYEFQRSKPAPIELRSGQTAEIVLPAK